MLRKNSKLLLLVVAIVILVSFTVAASNFPVKTTDDLGREVVIEEQPQRIISLAPSHTETLFALKLDKKIIGVTDYANYPKKAKQKTKVGTIREPSVEKIISLQPDLVLAAAITPKEVVNKLERLDITVVGLDPKTVSGVIKDISLIGKLTGQTKEAKKLTSNLRTRKEKVVQTVKENIIPEEKPTVFYEVWKNPLRTAGSGTFIDNLIQLAGGVNIAHGAKQQWPQYSFEQLLVDNPDVYLATTHSWKSKVTVKTIKQRDKFQQLKAVKEGRICVLNPDLVNRTGPRIIDALEKIAKALHPDLF